MEVNHVLLYNLNVPLKHYETLRDYYYIPEGQRENMNESGMVICLSKGQYTKRVVFRGKYKRFENEFTEPVDSVHFFYKPRLTGFQRAMLALNNSLQNDMITAKPASCFSGQRPEKNMDLWTCP